MFYSNKIKTIDKLFFATLKSLNSFSIEYNRLLKSIEINSYQINSIFLSNNFLEEIIIDDQQNNYIENSSSFNVSVEGSQQSLDEDQYSQRSFNPMVPSTTMVFSKRTSPGEDILEQSASNEEMKNNQNQNSSQNEGNQTNACFNPDQLKNKRECPNYTICKGLGNKDSNKKKHWVIDKCPKNCIENKETLAKFDQNSEIIIYSSSDENSINNESSNNQSMISNKTDNSEIKEIYAKSQIPRTKSFSFKSKPLI